jgi:outer membrane lipoprotein-sorting protein
MNDEGLMGTDLTAGELDLMRDMLKWTAADIRATLRGPERLRGADAYKLEVTNVSPYPRIVLWVDAGDLVMRQLELYGSDATVVKRIRQTDIRLVGAVPVPTRVEVESPAAGTRSIFDLVDVQFDVGFPDDVFSLPLLASPAK